MSVHLICPSLRCRKILTMSDDVRGTLVNCRYCGMEFRVPRVNRTPTTSAGVVSGSTVSTVSNKIPPPPFGQPR